MDVKNGNMRVERNKLKVLYRRIKIEDMGDGLRWIVEVENEFTSVKGNVIEYESPSVRMSEERNVICRKEDESNKTPDR